MLKDILKLKGVAELKKEDQTVLKGSGGNIFCLTNEDCGPGCMCTPGGGICMGGGID